MIEDATSSRAPRPFDPEFFSLLVPDDSAPGVLLSVLEGQTQSAEQLWNASKAVAALLTSTPQMILPSQQQGLEPPSIPTPLVFGAAAAADSWDKPPADKIETNKTMRVVFHPNAAAQDECAKAVYAITTEYCWSRHKSADCVTKSNKLAENARAQADAVVAECEERAEAILRAAIQQASDVVSSGRRQAGSIMNFAEQQRTKMVETASLIFQRGLLNARDRLQSLSAKHASRRVAQRHRARPRFRNVFAKGGFPR